MTEDQQIIALQDKILSALCDGRMDHESLRQLPPWRAVLLGRVAYKAGVMERADLDYLIKEARDTGGEGQLRTWDHVLRLAQRKELNREHLE